MYRTKGLGVAYQDTVSLSSSLFPSRLFSLSSPLFRCRLRHKPRTVLRLLYFPYLSRPPHHALCRASTSCVKLCAIPLTFDNRCSSGNYIPVLATNSLLHFMLTFSLQTSAFLRLYLFALECNPQEAKISSP